MRPSTRFLASVQRGAKYLTPGAPTGLTGLLTHDNPRGTLLYLYSSTLDKLKQFPEHSVYRQSTEALTKHRMSILESIKPAGLEAWQKRVQPVVDQHPEAFRKVPVANSSDYNIVWKLHDVRANQPAAEDVNIFKTTRAQIEGMATEAERRHFGAAFARDTVAEQQSLPTIENEPPLTAEQIGEIEAKIGAGLIEEVIQVAEGEKALADTLFENQVWEDLVEKPEGNQWHYNERDTHTGKTQAP